MPQEDSQNLSDDDNTVNPSAEDSPQGTANPPAQPEVGEPLVNIPLSPDASSNAVASPIEQEQPEPGEIISPDDVKTSIGAPLPEQESPSVAQPVIIPVSPPALSSVPTTPTPPALSKEAILAGKFVEGMVNWQQHLNEALAKKRERVQARQLQILRMAEKSPDGIITNYQVQKLFRCAQLTAYRYLKALEKQGKLKRIGGHNDARYQLVR